MDFPGSCTLFIHIFAFVGIYCVYIFNVNALCHIELNLWYLHLNIEFIRFEHLETQQAIINII